MYLEACCQSSFAIICIFVTALLAYSMGFVSLPNVHITVQTNFLSSSAGFNKLHNADEYYRCRKRFTYVTLYTNPNCRVIHTFSISSLKFLFCLQLFLSRSVAAVKEES